MNFPKSLCFPVVMALSCVACESRHVGEQEQLVFVYDSPFDNETFNKPVVVGGRLEVSVEELQDHGDEERHVTITSVQSSDPDVLAIEGKVGDMFELEAKRAGKATLTVKALDEEGRALEDRVVMRADAMTRMTLSHTCSQSEVAYMLEQNASFQVELARFNARGERLSGFGHAPLEVSPDPAHVRTPVLSQAVVEIITRGTRGDVRVSSKHAEQQLTMKRIGLKDITHLGTDFDPVDRMLVDSKMLEFFALFVGEHAVCEPTWPMKITNHTPKVCEVTAGDEEGEGRDEGVVMIHALSTGKCSYSVGIDGHDVSRQMTISVGRLVFDEPDEQTAVVTRPAPVPEAPGLPWWLASLLALCIPGALAPLWWALIRRRGQR